MELKQIIKEKNKTVYQQIAEKHSVSVQLVGKIARGERMPQRGKGLEVKKELELLIAKL